MDSSSDNNNTAMDHQLRQTPADHPVQCAGGCGFFGTAENNWLCSKCYGYYIKEKIIQSRAQVERVRVDQQVSAISEEFKKSVTISDEITEPVVVAKTNNRCGCCNKKVGLLGFKCRCGGNFCGTHRYPEAHTCDFDYKKAGRIAIEKENPVVKADKLRLL